MWLMMNVREMYPNRVLYEINMVARIVYVNADITAAIRRLKNADHALL